MSYSKLQITMTAVAMVIMIAIGPIVGYFASEREAKREAEKLKPKVEVGYCADAAKVIDLVKEQGFTLKEPLSFDHRTTMVVSKWFDGRDTVVIEDDMLQKKGTDTACITEKFTGHSPIIKM